MNDPVSGRFVLADDFLCNVTGPITEIHIWGSWLWDDIPGNPGSAYFTLSIHEDIPADESPNGWSVPGALTCLYEFEPGAYEVVEWEVQSYEGFMFPPFEWIPEGDSRCFEYIFRLPNEECIQTGTETEPKVYWLDVQASVPSGPAPVYFGWKTTPITFNWNDDAVFAPGAEPVEDPEAWAEMTYPEGHPWFPQSINMAFSIYSRPEADTCANQYPGDFDNDGDIDTDDLSDLQSFVATGGPAPPVPANGDFNGDCRINQFDVDDMTDYLASGDPLPVDCTCQLPCPFRDCCIGMVGNVNIDPLEQVTIGDVSWLVDHLFIDNPVLPCTSEADVNQSGGLYPTQGPGGDLTIGDVSIMVDYLFITGPETYGPLKDCLW
jgi:hypothetical protein